MYMNVFARIKAYVLALTKGKIAVAAIAVVVLGVWAYQLHHKGNVTAETLAVHETEFVEGVSVSGKVVAAKTVDLGFSQSGRIAAVYAKVGSAVKAGSILAQIENGDFRADLLQRQANLEAQQAKLESIKAGKRPEEIAITESIVANDSVSVLQSNQTVFNAVQSAYTVADSAIRTKVDQFISNPRTSNPQLIFISNGQLRSNVESERSLIEKMLVAWQLSIANLNMSSGLSVAQLDAQTKLSQTLLFLSDVSAVLNAGSPGESVTPALLSQYVSDIATARANINTAISVLATAIAAQESATATLEKDQRTLALNRAGATQADIDTQNAAVKAAQADVENAQAQLAKTIVVAPFEGIITAMDAKAGAIVSPNTPQISMISAGTFQIETYIPEVNIVRVKVGAMAAVTLDAYGTQTPFHATVVLIDPAETVRDGVSTYKTTLQFDGPDERIRSGMTANIEIIISRSEHSIVIPSGALFEDGGRKFVQVVLNGKPQAREVTVGSTSSLGKTEIMSGLVDGDVIVLSPSH